jgi:hypothetical protein
VSVKECVNVSEKLFIQGKRENEWEFVLSTIKHIKSKLIAYSPWEWMQISVSSENGSTRNRGTIFFSFFLTSNFFMTLVKLLMDFFDWICWAFEMELRKSFLMALRRWFLREFLTKNFYKKFVYERAKTIKSASVNFHFMLWFLDMTPIYTLIIRTLQWLIHVNRL